jgi:hypothetical protein
MQSWRLISVFRASEANPPWGADFVHVEVRVLIEIKSGIWVNGRHNRAAGFNAGLEQPLRNWRRVVS